MNILRITKCSLCDGIGNRVVLWVSGCDHHCKGCQNQWTWNCNKGKPFTEEDMQLLFSLLDKPYIKGLTLSGGDPLFMGNRDKVTEIAKRVKEKFPAKDIWCYTGYRYEEVKNLPIMQYIDVLVDGKYEEENRDITLAFRGSSNQRIIEVGK